MPWVMKIVRKRKEFRLKVSIIEKGERSPKITILIKNCICYVEIQNKEKHQIYAETLVGKKNHGQKKKKLHYEYERNYKVQRIGHKP